MAFDKKVGFIGLGNIGKPMAANLETKCFHLTVFDIRPEPVDELVALGAGKARSAKETCELSDIVITMVRNSDQIDAMFAGQDGLWQGFIKGSVFIITSTVDPQYCRKLAGEAGAKGVHVLDAVVSGGTRGATTGTLTLMVGGEKAVFDECYPVFEGLGKQVFYMGGAGSGETMKLVNNMIAIINIAGSSEAISVGLKAGIALDRMLEVVKASTGNNNAIQNWHHMANLMREVGPASRNY